jgi:TPR repeat protein
MELLIALIYYTRSWYSQAAEQNCALAQYYLQHQFGEQDICYLEKAAAQGLPQALLRMAYLMRDTNPEHAFQLLLDLSERTHNLEAMHNLVKMLLGWQRMRARSGQGSAVERGSQQELIMRFVLQVP